MSKKHLDRAKKEKNDEYYTQLSDIERELPHYECHFKGKTVYCNCDNPEQSKFWEYFHKNFARLGLVKLTSTYYAGEGGNAYKTEYTGGDDDNIKAWMQTPLHGNGDFYSDECLKLLKTADIVVTNPPFSLLRKFIGVLRKYHKDFIIIAPLTQLSYNVVVDMIMQNMLSTGVNSISNFVTPNNTMAGIGCCWLTTIQADCEKPYIELNKPYNMIEHRLFDNYRAINVNAVKDIPCDYDGVMGVPLTYLLKHNPKQFKVVGTTGQHNKYHARRTRVGPYVDGQKKFERILIQPCTT